MEIKDLTGFGEPLAKLIDVISRGVGKVSAPYLLRKQTGAKVDEVEKLAAVIQRVSGETGLSIAYRDGAVEVVAPERVPGYVSAIPAGQTEAMRESFQSQVRQENVEAITSIAAGQLIGEEAVSSANVEQDWINRFFRYAEDVSSEEMQKVWAKLLAGEVLRPGSFSLRTMEFIKGLSISEARMIDNVSSLVMTGGDRWFIPAVDVKEFGGSFSFERRFSLTELGLLYPTELTLALFPIDEKPVDIYQGDHLLHIEPPRPRREVAIPSYKLTALGAEVVRLLDVKAHHALLQMVGSQLASHGCKVTMGKIISKSADETLYSVLRVIS
ncbi:DUF2806 domain-containing protein [Luteibacter sp. E-22]|uniref:DUF2806 domain-containing protein n=1 Tax=Luteibacter sp. E-22 TaxID=3404050 RepID=UPI003CF7DA74